MTNGFCSFLLLGGGGGDGNAGWAGAGFCSLLCLEIIMYNKIFIALSVAISVALDVFLSSLKCEMNGTSQGMGGLYSVIWITILDPDFLIPTHKNNQSCREGSGTCSQLVCLSLWLVCL